MEWHVYPFVRKLVKILVVGYYSIDVFKTFGESR
jgi:hypothetical protein